MGKADFLYSGFVSRLQYEPTSCQEGLLRKVAEFVSSDESDILVVNGYAGTGKTTAISSVISVMKEFQTKCVLLAPTGRAAKVLSSYTMTNCLLVSLRAISFSKPTIYLGAIHRRYWRADMSQDSEIQFCCLKFSPQRIDYSTLR